MTKAKKSVGKDFYSKLLNPIKKAPKQALACNCDVPNQIQYDQHGPRE